jgi:hypothetical protein
MSKIRDDRNSSPIDKRSTFSFPVTGLHSIVYGHTVRKTGPNRSCRFANGASCKKQFPQGFHSEAGPEKLCKLFKKYPVSSLTLGFWSTQQELLWRK